MWPVIWTHLLHQVWDRKPVYFRGVDVDVFAVINFLLYFTSTDCGVVKIGQIKSYWWHKFIFFYKACTGDIKILIGKTKGSEDLLFLEECDISSQPLCGVLNPPKGLGCKCHREQLHTGLISFLTGLGAGLPTSLQCRSTVNYIFLPNRQTRAAARHLTSSHTQVINNLQLITGAWVTLHKLNKLIEQISAERWREPLRFWDLWGVSIPQKAPDIHTTHWGAGLCWERTAIVTAVSGQAVIVQLPLWDWLRRAGPPYDLNTHTVLEAFPTCFPMVILSWNLLLVWEGATWQVMLL